MIIKKPIHDITGKRFGNLEVLKMQYASKKLGFVAVCKCHICNRENYIIKPADLKNGSKNLENCGCDKSHIFEHLKGKNNKNFNGYEGLGGSYVSKTKRRAKEHDFEFDLTAKKLWTLFIKQNKKCALSGVEISLDTGGNREYKYFKQGTASLDRIDSNKGYVKGNVQWVHKTVNLMKNILSEKEFIDWCHKISSHAHR